MSRQYEGSVVGTGLKIGVVNGQFNHFITSKLYEGAIGALRKHGVSENDIETAWVPGAFEIPRAARLMAESGRFDAVLTLGAVIRGSTPHFDYVCNEVAKGVGELSRKAAVPVIFGVLTVDTIEQAIERAGTKAGNNGASTAIAAIEMANLDQMLKEM